MGNKKLNAITSALQIATGCGLFLCSNTIFAQENETQESDQSTTEIEEIIVVSERRSSGIQSVPVSVSVRTGDTLRTEGKFQLRDILENIPGITGGAAESANGIAGGGTDTAGAGVVIRGMQSNSGVGGSSTSVASSVATYTDDVYEGIGGSYDLSWLEVLRGPQGTLYGRSATGGVLAFRTRNPNLYESEMFALGEYGSDGLNHVSGAYSLPLIEDKVGVRISGDRYERDGFDSPEGKGRRLNENARIKVLAEPVENLSLLFGAAMQNNHEGTGGHAWRIDGNGDIYETEEPLGEGENQFRQYWANISYSFNDMVFSYIPAYRSWEQDAEIVAAGPGFTISQNLKTPSDKFVTHEVRLASDYDSDFKWQLGILSYDNELQNTNSVSFNLPGSPLAFSALTRKQTEALGIFGESTIPVSDDFRITAGLRYDTTKVNVKQDYTDGRPFTGLDPVTLSLSEEQGNLDFKNWTYKLRADYDLTDKNMMYVSVSSGFTPGDASVTTDLTGQPQPVRLDDQTLKAYEIGSKNRFLGGSLQVNGSLYYYDYSGYQTAGIDINPDPNILSFTTLVSPMEMLGGEIEMQYKPTADDEIILNLSYTDAKYKDSSDLFRTHIADDTLAGVPPFTAFLGYSHYFEMSNGSTIRAGLDTRLLSSHYAGTINQQSYAYRDYIENDTTIITNLNLVWNSPEGKYSISGYVRNLTDERYFIDADYEASGASGTFSYSAPRTIGVLATINY